MKKRKNKYLIANWKLYPQTELEAKRLFISIKKVSEMSKIQTVICPPHLFISKLSELSSNLYTVGAQDGFEKSDGAYTGEVSISMLAKAGVKYIILGHSERRNKETYFDVNKKILECIQHEVRPIICIGEEERDARGTWKKTLQRQMTDAFDNIAKKYVDQVMIAYEPVWAIGSVTKTSANPEEFVKARDQIKSFLKKKYKTQSLVDSIPILYGGSAYDKNAESFLEKDVDGFLLGRASLDPRILSNIIRLLKQYLFNEK